MNLIELDASAGPRRVAEEISTVPMFRGPKVVIVQPAEFLAPRKSARGDPFAKAADLWSGGKTREAARRVLGLAARGGFALAELDRVTAERWKSAGFEVGRADLELIAKAVELARAEGLEVPESDGRPLEDLFARGFPEGHTLLLATEELDAKAPLARLCLEQGVELVRELKGQSAGFGKRETADLGALAAEVLKPLGKALSAEAARRLSQANLDARGAANELAKLAAYVGDRPTIELADVRELVPEGLSEDLFAVSNAVEARDRAALVAAIEEEAERGAVPLQILGSFAVAVRGLLSTRARLSSLGLEQRFSFQEFERRAAPAFAAADKAAGKKPGHPFRAFKRAEGALKYSMPELSRLLCDLAEADAGIKRGMGGQAWLLRVALNV